MFYIIDRRLNPRDKSLGNSQRFKNRARAAIKQFVDETVNTDGEKIKQLGHLDAKIKSSKIHEPSFHLDHSKGDFIYVLPGNINDPDTKMTWIENDQIPKPLRQGRKNGSSPDGEGEDDFTFALTEEEQYQYLFEDLALPNQEQLLKDTAAFNKTKAGYTSSGSPSNMATKRTLRNSLGRRLALNRPKMEELDDLIEKAMTISDDPEDPDLQLLLQQIEQLKSQMVSIPYIDPIDVKFHHIVKLPKPIFKAVMFCLMDVSGSMSAHMKDLAKRFYILLYRFLKQRYERVDVVFIRYHSIAKTVEEKEFFYSTESGGTVVSTALVEMLQHVEETYNPKDWNIYVAHASDGDNWFGDMEKVKSLTSQIIPISKYYAYLEIGSEHYDEFGYSSWGGGKESDLWPYYTELANAFPSKFAMKRAKKRNDIYPVFVELFQKREK